MKKIVILSTLVLIFACDAVNFDRPQPLKGETLTSIPPELHGKWIDQSDTIYITKEGQHTVSVAIDSLKQVKIKRTKNYLSDSLIVKKTGEYYTVNRLEGNKWKLFYVVKKDSKENILWYTPYVYPFFGERKGLTIDSICLINKDSVAKKTIYTSLKTIKTVSEVKQIGEVYYKGDLKKSDLKKICKPDHLQIIFNTKGIVEYPQKETKADSVKIKKLIEQTLKE